MLIEIDPTFNRGCAEGAWFQPVVEQEAARRSGPPGQGRPIRVYPGESGQVYLPGAARGVRGREKAGAGRQFRQQGSGMVSHGDGRKRERL